MKKLIFVLLIAMGSIGLSQLIEVEKDGNVALFSSQGQIVEGVLVTRASSVNETFLAQFAYALDPSFFVCTRYRNLGGTADSYTVQMDTNVFITILFSPTYFSEFFRLMQAPNYTQDPKWVRAGLEVCDKLGLFNAVKNPPVSKSFSIPRFNATSSNTTTDPTVVRFANLNGSLRISAEVRGTSLFVDFVPNK